MQPASQEEQNLILRECIQKVATGPEYSKDLSYDEAYAAMSEILTGTFDPVQAGIFLIALRMKRETQEENKGALRAILDTVDFQQADADQVIDITDPYDGFTRGLPMTPFLPALLASTGLCAYSHGVESVGPKYGVTHHKVLQAAGYNTQLDAQSAVDKINQAGWGYVDQQQFCPALYGLHELRTRIVKRPVITTVEVLAGPIKGTQSSHLITGYVHKAYPPIYIDLADFAGFASAAIIRGCEGGITPSLQQEARLFDFDGKATESRIVDPKALGIARDQRATPIPQEASSHGEGDSIAVKHDIAELAKFAAEEGIKALQGEPGYGRDSLLYSGSIVLTHLKIAATMEQAHQTLAQKLDNGDAWGCFQRGIA